MDLSLPPVLPDRAPPADGAAPASGAAMDRTLAPAARRRARRLRLARQVALVLMAGAAAALSFWSLPTGVAVAAAELDISPVVQGTFLDELASRARVAPLNSVMLDATEGGRVEAVLVRDGAPVRQGELLFRLSNPQRSQEVMARSADVAQQLANLSGMRASLDAARLAHRRELANLVFEAERLAKTHARNLELGRQGFLSASAVEESGDKLAQQQKLVEQVKADGAAELATREKSVQQMDRAIEGLQAALAMLRTTADGLAVRAPASGRLTGFALQQGESVKPGDRVGRIDSLDRFKLTAQIDEFYLARVSPGLKGTVEYQGRRHPVTLARFDAQVKEGRFGAEFSFDGEAPAGLQAGQAMDLRLSLGRPAPATLVADGPYYADSGGAWVFVVDADGTRAVRREVRLGRRAAGQVEVLGGLKPGEQVVTSGVRRFADASTLRISR